MMNNNISIYEKPKMVFLDTVDIKNYVYMDRISHLKKPFKNP